MGLTAPTPSTTICTNGALVASLGWNGLPPSGVASNIRPGNDTVAPQLGNGIAKVGVESGPAVPIQQSESEVAKLASEPEAKQKEKQNGDSGGAEEKDQSAKEGEPGIAPQEEKKPEQANGPRGEEVTQAGEKRKADEAAVPEGAASLEDQEAKKQKTTNGAVAADEAKKEPEAPKPAEKKARAPKKEKKVPRTGIASRQTRSQGAAPVAGL
jgi:hypothetical protein